MKNLKKIKLSYNYVLNVLNMASFGTHFLFLLYLHRTRGNSDLIKYTVVLCLGGFLSGNSSFHISITLLRNNLLTFIKLLLPWIKFS